MADTTDLTARERVEALLGRLDAGELREVAKRAHELSQSKARDQWSKGDRVTFTGKGSQWKGTIERVNKNTCTVMCDVKDGEDLPIQRKWRVSPSLLERA